MPDSNEPFSEHLPLREPTFFILLSLVPGPKHGYAILKDVEALSQDKVRLSTGTLYEALARLLDQKLVERVPAEELQTEPGEDKGGKDPDSSISPGQHPGKPRKAYRLTRAGSSLLEAETHRLQSLVSAAQRRFGELPR